MPFTDVYGVEQFRDLVNQTALTVVYFSAVWCGPCKSIEKDMEKITYDFPTVSFAKVDSDNNAEIVFKCKITQIPTFMLIKDGKLLNYVIGADVPQLKTKIREALKG